MQFLILTGDDTRQLLWLIMAQLHWASVVSYPLHPRNGANFNMLTDDNNLTLCLFSFSTSPFADDNQLQRAVWELATVHQTFDKCDARQTGARTLWLETICGHRHPSLSIFATSVTVIVW